MRHVVNLMYKQDELFGEQIRTEIYSHFRPGGPICQVGFVAQ